MSETEKNEPFYVTLSALAHLHRFEYDIAEVLLKTALKRLQSLKGSVKNES